MLLVAMPKFNEKPETLNLNYYANYHQHLPFQDYLGTKTFKDLTR